MENIKYKIQTKIAIFEIKKEPLGLWDLWINSMPTLTFSSPEDAANAVINKKTGYSVWDNQSENFGCEFSIENWSQLPED
tara:strand:- start:84 stop:323 length:240 start_codon:yes stop_codon:yes gene_type:complete